MNFFMCTYLTSKTSLIVHKNTHTFYLQMPVPYLCKPSLWMTPYYTYCQRPPKKREVSFAKGLQFEDIVVHKSLILTIANIDPGWFLFI